MNCLTYETYGLWTAICFMQGWTVTQGMDSQEKEEENYKKDIEKLLRKSSKKKVFLALDLKPFRS